MNEGSGADGSVNYEGQSAYDVADMLKQYFRDLPEPLLSSKLSETFLQIYQCKNTPTQSANTGLCTHHHCKRIWRIARPWTCEVQNQRKSEHKKQVENGVISLIPRCFLLRLQRLHRNLLFTVKFILTCRWCMEHNVCTCVDTQKHMQADMTHLAQTHSWLPHSWKVKGGLTQSSTLGRVDTRQPDSGNCIFLVGEFNIKYESCPPLLLFQTCLKTFVCRLYVLQCCSSLTRTARRCRRSCVSWATWQLVWLRTRWLRPTWPFAWRRLSFTSTLCGERRAHRQGAFGLHVWLSTSEPFVWPSV